MNLVTINFSLYTSLCTRTFFYNNILILSLSFLHFYNNAIQEGNPAYPAGHFLQGEFLKSQLKDGVESKVKCQF